MTSSSPRDPIPDSFHTTQWTRVCLAKTDSSEGRDALADLCEAYYEPVHTFLRCELRDPDAAKEMSQAFFASLLGGGKIESADASMGKFRSYLLGAVKHFLSHERAAAKRLKRGGGQTSVPFDDPEVNATPSLSELSPDAAYDRQWAVTLLDRALTSLRTDFDTQKGPDFFDRIKPWLTGEAEHGDQAALAEQLGMSQPALKMTIHRLKRRFRHAVKAEVANTLEDPSMVETEMGNLFASLGG